MGMDYGPDVLYHLATNVAEAQKIASQPLPQATLALGRLEARYALLAEEKTDKNHVEE